MELVQLGHDLVRGLGPRTMPEECGDVAELAVIGATPRVLDRTGGVSGKIHQLPEGERRPAEIGELPGLVDARGASMVQVGQKRG